MATKDKYKVSCKYQFSSQAKEGSLEMAAQEASNLEATIAFKDVKKAKTLFVFFNWVEVHVILGLGLSIKSI